MMMMPFNAAMDALQEDWMGDPVPLHGARTASKAVTAGTQGLRPLAPLRSQALKTLIAPQATEDALLGAKALLFWLEAEHGML